MNVPKTHRHKVPSLAENTGGMREERDVAIADLEEVRFTLMRVGANSPVNLRDYLAEDSAAWHAMARVRPNPATTSRRSVVVGWIDSAIDHLEDGNATSTGGSETEPITRGTPLRKLTSRGIAKAQAFLQHLRDNPDADRTPPQEILHGEGSQQFANPDLVVDPRTFNTRREAGEYLSSVLAPVRNQVMNDAGVWSWLGMYFLTGTAPKTLSPNNMTLIFESGENTSNAGRSEQQTYRHYLWGSWRLYEQHGEKAAFLLNQPISSLDDLSQRTFGSRRVFTSVGIVEVILRLYTDGRRKKRGHVHSPGGIRHLFRVLPQLELTYDVYGMEADAVLRILPEPFRRWDAGPS